MLLCIIWKIEIRIRTKIQSQMEEVDVFWKRIACMRRPEHEGKHFFTGFCRKNGPIEWHVPNKKASCQALGMWFWNEVWICGQYALCMCQRGAASPNLDHSILPRWNGIGLRIFYEYYFSLLFFALVDSTALPYAWLFASSIALQSIHAFVTYLLW